MATREPDEPVATPSQTSQGAASDRSLLRRLQHGQADASTELYLRYAERLHALVVGQCWRRQGMLACH